jgi:hypothetical protein
MIDDNTGFIIFPNKNNKSVKTLDIGKTMIYIVAFDPKDISQIKEEYSNVNIGLPGTFVGDDVSHRTMSITPIPNTLDDLIDDQIENDNGSIYFPHLKDSIGLPNTDIIINQDVSISMCSVICIGWSNFSYLIKDSEWVATFRDLSNEGRKMYYAVKKLHNTKEVRILTFNNI